MLLSIASKVLCRVLLNRMKGVADTKLRDEQAGFLRGRSCTDHIATLRIIVEQSVEWQDIGLHMLCGFSKAFASIHRETLWKLLRRYGIPLKVLNIIGKYSTSCTQWQINREISDADRRLTGMSAFPLLFLIALDWVTREEYGSSDKGLPW